MIRLVAFTALAGCNWFYGLDDTHGIDASPKQFFDAPPDAPFRCPEAGVPRFKAFLNQVPVQNCYSYTPSDRGAIAFCSASGVSEGPLDQAMANVLPMPTGVVFEPRVFPEGDRLFAKNVSKNVIEAYARNGATFAYDADVIPAMPSDLSMSNPSRGPNPRAFSTFYENAYLLVEYEADGAGWRERDRYPLIGPPFAGQPSLTGDGLRLVVGASPMGIWYAQRASLADRFGTFTKLDTVPSQATYPFLTDDCGKLYFSALDTVLWLQQE